MAYHSGLYRTTLLIVSSLTAAVTATLANAIDNGVDWLTHSVDTSYDWCERFFVTTLEFVATVDAYTSMAIDAVRHTIAAETEQAKPFEAFAERQLLHERYRTATGFSDGRSIA